MKFLWSLVFFFGSQIKDFKKFLDVKINFLKDYQLLYGVTATGFEPTTTYFVNEHSTKWLRVRLRSKWLWVRISLLSLKLQISHLLRARSSLTFRQLECRFTLKRIRDTIIIYGHCMW